MAALAIGKEGGAKSGHGPPQTLKRLSICGFAKCPGVRPINRGLAGGMVLGRDVTWAFVPASLLEASLPLMQVRQMAGPVLLGIRRRQWQPSSLLPAPSTFLRALPHPLPSAVHQQTDPLPSPAVLSVLSFPRLLTRLPFCPDLPTASQLPSSANQPRQQESLLVSGSIPLRANACLAWRRHTQYT